MARTTFEGPVFIGDTRVGPLRNVGTPVLSQTTYLDFSNTTVGTYGYSGGSSQFVTANNIDNTNATIYTPSTSAYPPVVSTPTADVLTTTPAVYRGCVFYIPAASVITNIYTDVTAVLASTGGTTPAYAQYISNNFVTTGGNYGTASLTNTAGARTTTTYSATQLPIVQATPIDIPQRNGYAGVTQVVVTFAFTAASGTFTAPVTGKVYVTLQYLQNDPIPMNMASYPYGNLG